MVKLLTSAPLKIFYMACMLVLFSCDKDSISPSQAESFYKLFGNYLKDTGYDVKSLPDGGYVITGSVSTPSKGKDMVLIRTDKYGNEVWKSRQYGGEGDAEGLCIQLLDDGGFIILGSAVSGKDPEEATTNMFLVRTNSKGDTIWTRTYGGAQNEVGYDVKSTSDGGFILIGFTESFGQGGKDIWLVKTNSLGDTLWTRTHGGSEDEVGKCIVETSYGYIFTGYTKSYSEPGQANANILVVKVNTFGKEIFPFTYGGLYDDIGESIVALPEGGYVVCGTIRNPPSGIANVIIFKLEENIANYEWSKIYGGQISHVASSLKVTKDNGFIVSGTKELSASNHNVFLLRTNSKGDELNISTFGGMGLQRGEAVDITNDGGYIVTGSNEFNGNSMITLIKTKDIP